MDNGDNKRNKILIFGLGFTGSRLANSLLKKKWEVVGTVRNRKETTSRHNVDVVVFDIGEFKRVKEILRSDTVTHVLVTAPPMRTGDGDPVLAVLSDELKEAHKRKAFEWVGYLSTTGVYGDCGGDIADETARLSPVSKRSERRVKAENGWSKLGLPVHIFRLPGIYGPGRGTLSRVRQGRTKPILKKGQVFNRVHVDDIVSALELSMKNPSKIIPTVYNVVDDLPAPQHVVTSYAFKILNLSIPDPVPFEKAEMSAMARSFYSSSRRATAQKIKMDLGWKPMYPTYIEGFRAQMIEETPAPKKTSSVVSLSLVTTFLLGAAYSLRKPSIAVAAVSTIAVMMRRRNNIACLVLDNGSVRARATISLRNIASRLQARLGSNIKVVPVSARWSNRVDPKELDGRPAELLSDAVDRLKRQGIYRFVLVPLFFGPSKTIRSFIPKIMSEKKDIDWSLADELCGGLWWCRDLRVARILCERSLQCMMHNSSLRNVTVLVVDHGSPSLEVTSARNRVADQVKSMLQMEVASSTNLIVRACSMERRPGPKYAFADPLLEHVLENEKLCRDRLVILALMFVSPGKHAGKHGDISEIVSNSSCASKHVVITNLVGTHPLLDDILADRFYENRIKK
jgi:nucleoside-diphosphate-sugar epimerase/sirohydrochlorin ferrochelatase